jgi:hypothetical protein
MRVGCTERFDVKNLIPARGTKPRRGDAKARRARRARRPMR